MSLPRGTKSQVGQLNTWPTIASILSDFDSGAVNPATGCALVELTLQVKLSSGARNIYAVGDIVDWNEQKVCKLDAYTYIRFLMQINWMADGI